eukprot:6350791-Prymnesium_polylepis.1
MASRARKCCLLYWLPPAPGHSASATWACSGMGDMPQQVNRRTSWGAHLHESAAGHLQVGTRVDKPEAPGITSAQGSRYGDRSWRPRIVRGALVLERGVCLRGRGAVQTSCRSNADSRRLCCRTCRC